MSNSIKLSKISKRSRNARYINSAIRSKELTYIVSNSGERLAVFLPRDHPLFEILYSEAKKGCING